MWSPRTHTILRSGRRTPQHTRRHTILRKRTTSDTATHNNRHTSTHYPSQLNPTHKSTSTSLHPQAYACSCRHPHAWRLVGREGPEVARARPPWRRNARPLRDHRPTPRRRRRRFEASERKRLKVGGGRRCKKVEKPPLTQNTRHRGTRG